MISLRYLLHNNTSVAEPYFLTNISNRPSILQVKACPSSILYYLETNLR